MSGFASPGTSMALNSTFIAEVSCGVVYRRIAVAGQLGYEGNIVLKEEP